MRNAAVALVALLLSLPVLAGGREITTPGPIAGNQWNPSVASDGVDFMAAFAEQASAKLFVTVARVSRSGSLLDNEGTRVDETRPIAQTSIVYGAGTYLVIWAEFHDIYARRFTTSGVAIDSDPILIRTNARSYTLAPAAAWNGNIFFIVWAEAGRIFGATMSTDGTISPPSALEPGLSSFDNAPDVAWNGQIFLVIWGLFNPCPFECLPMRIGTATVRVAANGMPIDSTPVLVETTLLNPPSSRASATVASNGRDFLVALDETRGISVVLVSRALEIGPKKEIFRWFGGIQSDIAFDGSDYVVAWRYPGVTFESSWLAVSRIRPNGDAYATVFTSAEEPSCSSGPAVATNRLGDALTTVCESVPRSGVARVRGYFDWEMQPMPSPPRPPRNVMATGNPWNFVLRWEKASSDTTGITVEYITPGGYPYTIAVVPADQQSIVFNNVALTSVQVRALNAGGMSEPVTVAIQSPPRRRATR